MSEYTPITGELRAAMRQWGWFESDGSITFVSSPMPPRIDSEKALAISGSDFDRMCDAIDAIHAQLERENESLKAELNRVLGEQEEHAHTMGESITGELREVAAKTECANGRCEKLYRGDLERIADCIDVEHKRAVMSAMNDALYHANDENMAELGWVRLPKDADGVPIRVGDTVEYVDDTLAPRNVTSINLAGDGWWVYINGLGRRPDRYRHVTPDTWERIIDDAEALAHEWFNTDMSENEHAEGLDALVTRCKALCARTKEDA